MRTLGDRLLFGVCCAMGTAFLLRVGWTWGKVLAHWALYGFGGQ